MVDQHDAEAAADASPSVVARLLKKGKPTAKVWDLAIGSHGSNTGDDHITDQPDHTNARREIKPTCALRGNNPRG
jgi:hypothetical protein